jgi:hypothetical protein
LSKNNTPSEFGVPNRQPGTLGMVCPGCTSTFSLVSVNARRVSMKPLEPVRSLGELGVEASA